MRLRSLLVALLLTAAVPASALAQPRTPAERQRVIDLAYVLGEAHALHRACAGTEDNTWRARMTRLLGVETPDPPYRQRLLQSFNAGFVARAAEFHGCTLKSAAAEREAAARGRALSRQLAAGVSP